ncbi:aminodeoxychorismate/anthranilate synthase component II [Catenovulum sp. SM1970]|uniref:anthranilate synthase component II n=1 Tax=Marinifaba aquimaris TaxID=2741323 RepID=UPI0015736E9D|nr:aminodeoxychorismate/anthranilate synthase component II [Marinifaba aquimaris]NTS76714.1 aminodeoxychorismate/anthranilate synthase component II [Marinifaba aquimaris]
MILIIDNYDSFTYNLSHYVQSLSDENVRVVRNDKVTIETIKNWNPSRIIISPGPCTPNESGVSLDVIKTFAGQVPILGVCLGHQCIAQVFGGKVIKAPQVMHGKVSKLQHNGHMMFQGVDTDFSVTRYHSLLVEKNTLPSEFVITAQTLDDNLIMAIAHVSKPIWGVQFHPESILSEFGHQLMANFLSCH